MTPERKKEGRGGGLGYGEGNNTPPNPWNKRFVNFFVDPDKWQRKIGIVILSFSIGFAVMLGLIAYDISISMPLPSDINHVKNEIDDPAHGLKEIKHEVNNTESELFSLSGNFEPLFFRDEQNKTTAIKTFSTPKTEMIVIHQGQAEFTESGQRWLDNPTAIRSGVYNVSQYRTISLLGSYVLNNESRASIETDPQGNAPVAVGLIFTDPVTGLNVTDAQTAGAYAAMIPVYAPQLQLVLYPNGNWIGFESGQSVTVRGNLTVSIYLSS